jgi:hypothetical protein
MSLTRAKAGGQGTYLGKRASEGLQRYHYTNIPGHVVHREWIAEVGHSEVIEICPRADRVQCLKRAGPRSDSKLNRLTRRRTTRRPLRP